MPLKTNYKNFIPSTPTKIFDIKQASDDTVINADVKFEDVTVYSQEGDSFGSADINATNAQVNANTDAVALKAPLANPTFTGLITTAGQVAFPATQNPSADPNTLDDYEEGTWIPVIYGETVAGVGTYANQIGNFTKIGNLIRFQIYIEWSAHSGSGQLRISLPFTTASGIVETAISGYGASGTYPTTTNINFFIASSVNYIRPDYRNSTNGAYVSGVLVATSGYFTLSGTVQV